jgi:hypothetical protein
MDAEHTMNRDKAHSKEIPALGMICPRPFSLKKENQWVL